MGELLPFRRPGEAHSVHHRWHPLFAIEPAKARCAAEIERGASGQGASLPALPVAVREDGQAPRSVSAETAYDLELAALVGPLCDAGLSAEEVTRLVHAYTQAALRYVLNIAADHKGDSDAS